MENQVEISEEIKEIAESDSGVMNSDNVQKTSNIIDKLVDLNSDSLDEEVCIIL